MKAFRLVALFILCASSARSEDIGFAEDFALSDHRADLLSRLVPGSEEHAFYSCLCFQQAGELDKVDALLPAWIARHGVTDRVREIENRQALLRYAKAPKTTLPFLRDRLALHLDHQRQVPGGKPTYPSSLDAAALSYEALLQEAFRRSPNLDGITDEGLEALAGRPLDPGRRRDLLRRLRRPDAPRLVDLVLADMRHWGYGFGSQPIHGQLLKAQLDACAAQMPELLNQAPFVEAYLAKLQPGPEEAWRTEPKVREAYLDRLWTFTERLGPAHNSLKALVLYHRLLHDHAQGIHDRGRFLAYLALPRAVPYIREDYLQKRENRAALADLGRDYRPGVLLGPVGNDEPLVRTILSVFLETEEDWSAFSPFVRDDYLKPLFAEAKILSGTGDMERWYSVLNDPARRQALQARVDLEFASTNRVLYGAEEPVSVDLDVKNVPTLLVKVYEVNTEACCREQSRDPDLSIDLDGLQATEEKTYTYADPPSRRIRRHFDFPSLDRRGVYVVEFIGNGHSSRALIRKGGLSCVERLSAAGHRFRVFDEAGRSVPKASIWMGQRRYEPGPTGEILLPFTEKPVHQPIVLESQGFSCMASFDHRSQDFALSAGFYVDRESLIRGARASLWVRPSLCVHGEPVSLGLLEASALEARARDLDGIETVLSAPEVRLFEDRETLWEFRVPVRLASLTFTLTGRVRPSDGGEPRSLAASRTLQLNGIDATAFPSDFFLSRAPDGYVLRVLGRNGEPRADFPLTVSLRHRSFREPVRCTLQSDAKGRIALGALADVLQVEVESPAGPARSWDLPRDGARWPAVVQARTGEPVRLPYFGAKVTPAEVSLLERRGGTYVADWIEHAALEEGALVLKNLPPGDYELFLKEAGVSVPVSVTGGEARDGGWAFASTRALLLGGASPLNLTSVAVDGDFLRIRVAGEGKTTRVHVVGNRFVPEYALLSCLRTPSTPSKRLELEPEHAEYVSGREIGDEARYVLERRFAERYPGMMLERPSLILNPWAVRGTDVAPEVLAGEERLGSRGAGGRRNLTKASGGGPAVGQSLGSPMGANLDFLASPALVLANLVPDEKGEVRVPLKALEGFGAVQVAALAPEQTVLRHLSLADLEPVRRDLRLAAAFDPERHLVARRQASHLAAGEKVELEGVEEGGARVYDTLGKVYDLFLALSGDETLKKFGFILDWSRLDEARKRELYAANACHELHLFLYRKDPPFFEKVVKPYLANKKDKTFLDAWLLGRDLSAWKNSWRFSRLNIVERILLAERLPEVRPEIQRQLKDLFELMPPDPEREERLFATVLRGRDLDSHGDPANGFSWKRGDSDLERGKGALLESLKRKEGNALMPPTPASPAEPPAVRVKDMYDQRRLHGKPEKTQEWAEDNYWHLLVSQQGADLVPMNGFWMDLAQTGLQGGFLSAQVSQVAGDFHGMMLALALLDLPFEAGEPVWERPEGRLRLTAKTPLLLFYRAVVSGKDADPKVPVLVGQNLFRMDDRYRFEGAERADKLVTEEFLTSVAYGCQVVLTNPGSSRLRLEVLLQIPQGALPLMGGFETRTVPLQLEPFATRTIEYAFYFPAEGSFPMHPVHAAKGGSLAASAASVVLKAVSTPTRMDATSWEYVSQMGSPEEVLAFLQANNPGRLDLARIAWRMKEASFYQSATALLRTLRVHSPDLWAYAFLHEDPRGMREYLQNRPDFVAACGGPLDCELLTIDPVAEGRCQHLEYGPLVNARTHPVGGRREIPNRALAAQVRSLLDRLAYQPALTEDDRLEMAYYFLLQDRVREAKAQVARVDAGHLETRLQLDYLRAYLAFCDADPKAARKLAEPYRDHPVDAWRRRFREILAQADEAAGKRRSEADPADPLASQVRLAATEPSLELQAEEGGKLAVRYQNLTECEIRVYPMDLEFLFSKRPFVQGQSEGVAFVKPRHVETVRLPKGKDLVRVSLPAEFRRASVLVEASSGGVRRTVASYAHNLDVQVVEAYGQVRVSRSGSGKPVPKAYVKVYARMKGGEVRFYKDGYTDLRGRFDYTALNTDDLDQVERFSILVLSEEDGGLVREAAPPKQ